MEGSELGAAVDETLANLTLADCDTAAATLARQYAEGIDSAGDRGEALEKLGPKLLAVLESLGATPKARAAAMKGGPASGSDSNSKRAKLDELQQRRDRRARANGTAPMDATP